MVDIARQVAYWRDGAEEALGAARDLAEKHRWGFCLFLAHLALEKLLKAHVCEQTRDLAPRTHNLVRLAELAGLILNPEQVKLLARMNELQREGRYPNPLLPPPDAGTALEGLCGTEEMFQWLLRRL